MLNKSLEDWFMDTSTTHTNEKLLEDNDDTFPLLDDAVDDIPDDPALGSKSIHDSSSIQYCKEELKGNLFTISLKYVGYFPNGIN